MSSDAPDPPRPPDPTKESLGSVVVVLPASLYPQFRRGFYPQAAFVGHYQSGKATVLKNRYGPIDHYPQDPDLAAEKLRVVLERVEQSDHLYLHGQGGEPATVAPDDQTRDKVIMVFPWGAVHPATEEGKRIRAQADLVASCYDGRIVVSRDPYSASSYHASTAEAVEAVRRAARLDPVPGPSRRSRVLSLLASAGCFAAGAVAGNLLLTSLGLISFN